MSHWEEGSAAPGVSAPVGPIGLISEPSAFQDLFGQTLTGKPLDLFPDAGDDVGVRLTDSQAEGQTLTGKPLGLFPDASGDAGTGLTDPQVEGSREGEAKEAMDVMEIVTRNTVEHSDRTEAGMVESLMNGLHQIEREEVVETTEARDQKLVAAEQQSVTSQDTSDYLPERISSLPKKPPNGGESQRPSGAGEHHRKPPTSGSQGGGSQSRRPSDGPEGHSSRNPSASTLVGDVLHSIASEDEEGRSRQRILAFAAKRYSTAVERNPDDHDALYNWALVLQESADNTGPEMGNPAKDALLEEACRKYEAATQLCPTLHEAFYNWAIAISDRAKIRGRTKEAEDLWKQACERYDKSVQLNWNSPQALNNWGLALQELGAIVPLKEKRAIVKKAIRKFRAAIRLRFDFHRAVYNLGTVLYGLAEDTLRGGRKLAGREPSPADLYSQSAIYIAAAHALKPDYPVYRSALRLVRSMLPLPYVKAGYLTIPPVGDSLAPHSDWQRLWFVLDHEALYEIEKVDRKSLSSTVTRRLSGAAESSSGTTSLRPSIVRIEMEDIVLMTPCADLSLPPGGGFRIDKLLGNQYLIADTWEAMDGWVDAIRLVYTIFARGKRDSLAGVLAG